MNIVFFGSSKYSTIVEEAVHKIYPISLVVTIPERKSGSQILVSPVKTFAIKNAIPIITADKLTDALIEQIANFSPDFLVVADYGLLLPKKLLKLPSKAPLNVHHSLLPKFRGPSPAPSAILSGEQTTGVTVMEMGEGLDTGDILAQKEYIMHPTDTTDSLLTTLNTLGAELLINVFGDFDKFHEQRKKQDESQATFTKHMKKEDGLIDLNNPPSSEQLDRMIRAYYPWPGVWTMISVKGKALRVKLLPIGSHPELLARHSGKSEQSEDASRISVLIQIEGKKPMTVKDFLNGYPREGKEILKKFLL